MAAKPSASDWISAMRLRTLPLSLSSILVGGAIVSFKPGSFALILTLAILTTIALQVLSNFANDYGDTQNGGDTDDRIGPQRAVQAGTISPSQMKKAMLLTGVVAFGLGLALIFFSLQGNDNWWLIALFIALGLGAIGAAIKYTAGKNPYGYRGLGDVFVFLFFGLIGVGGTYFLIQQDVTWEMILPAITIGAFATAVLNLNNMRDITSDALTGKRTLVVMLGAAKAKRYHFALVIIGWLSLSVFLVLFSKSPWMWLSMLPILLHIKHLAKVARTTEASDFDPELKVMALSTFVVSLLLFGTSLI
ncbi:MAG: 1,4-dihydroxy-2-naphthoate octaprenyltransferase [Flavobacteriales bacterium]|nr:1,4-dihydroxy-2-naphthoate octaprenyltransferase [Flavobacteriales bacterium]MDG1780510.1 1,4-dihydroxy-2-naphthoate octaprenyltransferase [Flavobacteriales bacterium]MDG2246914.1 1,4-dihydroxy-2-naphthoate octaprenyltransferase [Flavobacteriales bacterium]